MKAMKNQQYILSFSLLILVALAFFPLNALAEEKTYKFNELVFAGEYNIKNIRHSYADSEEKCTVTVNGSDVTVKIPAFGNFPSLEIHGTLDDPRYREYKYGSGSGRDAVFVEKHDNYEDIYEYGTIRGTIFVNNFYSDDSYNLFTRLDNKGKFIDRYVELHSVKYYNESFLPSGLESVTVHMLGFDPDVVAHYASKKPDLVNKRELARRPPCSYEPIKMHTTRSAIMLRSPIENKEIQQTETSIADVNPGEDGGTEINSEIVEGSSDGSSKSSAPLFPAIVVSLGGALAAAGALAANANKKKDGGESKKKRYKMYVYKSFGNAIKKGAPPVKVFARISQIIDGKESNSPELTKKIQASGENLSVRIVGIEGAYMAAEVSATLADAAEQGTVSFTFNGVGGAYRRNIIFRLAGEPEIVFPRDIGNGNWDINANDDTVQMIAGLGGRERLRFVIIDATEEPETIQFRDNDGFIINYERDPKLAFTYCAIIDNKTARVKKGANIIADKEDRYIAIEAIFKNGSRIQGSFTIELYPDGLSVLPDKEHIKNCYLIVNTLEDPKAGPGHAKIPPAIFDFMVCYIDRTTGKAVVLENPSFDHKDPDDKGKYGVLFKKNFEYRMSHMGAAGIWLYPQNTLPYLGDPYVAFMHLACEKDDQHFEGDLPLAIYGEKPKLPSAAEWQKAYAALKKDVQIFGIGSDPQIKALVRTADQQSAAQLEFLRRRIIEAGVCFYQQEGDAHRNFDKVCTNYILVAGALVKAGDLALEIILKKYAGGNGKIAANFINPLKNLLATYIGEYIANGNIEQAPNFIDTVLQGCEEALSAAMTGVFVGDDDLSGSASVMFTFGKWSSKVIDCGVASDEIKKRLGYVIAAYLLVCFTQHYNGIKGDKKAKGDIYLSVLRACQDLGLATFKAWLLDFVTKRCKSLFEDIGKACGKIYKQAMQKYVNEAAKKAGQNAYKEGVQAGFRATNHEELTKKAWDAARGARDAAEEKARTYGNKLLDDVAEGFGKKGAQVDKWLAKPGEWLAKNELRGESAPIVFSQVLSYIIKKKIAAKEADKSLSPEERARFNEMKERYESEESLGGDPKEVLYQYLSDELCLKIGNVFEDDTLDIMNVSVQVKDGQIILGIAGYKVVINILENISALIEKVFEYIFSWMNGLWNDPESAQASDGGADLRDRTEKDTNKIRKELEEQRQRLGSLKH